MRVLFGMIVGALITIGGAYVYDTRVSETATIERPMVNWDVVGKNWHQFTARVRDEWTKLTG
jgi:hypothetical protein